ncbi:hypothetical protein HDU76_000480, partial [Blyttiomyces sp. JEL0837]
TAGLVSQSATTKSKLSASSPVPPTTTRSSPKPNLNTVSTGPAPNVPNPPSASTTAPSVDLTQLTLDGASLIIDLAALNKSLAINMLPTIPPTLVMPTTYSTSQSLDPTIPYSNHNRRPSSTSTSTHYSFHHNTQTIQTPLQDLRKTFQALNRRLSRDLEKRECVMGGLVNRVAVGDGLVTELKGRVKALEVELVRVKRVAAAVVLGKSGGIGGNKGRDSRLSLLSGFGGGAGGGAHHGGGCCDDCGRKMESGGGDPVAGFTNIQLCSDCVEIFHQNRNGGLNAEGVDIIENDDNNMIKNPTEIILDDIDSDTSDHRESDSSDSSDRSAGKPVDDEEEEENDPEVQRALIAKAAAQVAHRYELSVGTAAAAKTAMVAVNRVSDMVSSLATHTHGAGAGVSGSSPIMHAGTSGAGSGASVGGNGNGVGVGDGRFAAFRSFRAPSLTGGLGTKVQPAVVNPGTDHTSGDHHSNLQAPPVASVVSLTTVETPPVPVNVVPDETTEVGTKTGDDISPQGHNDDDQAVVDSVVVGNGLRRVLQGGNSNSEDGGGGGVVESEGLLRNDTIRHADSAVSALGWGVTLHNGDGSGNNAVGSGGDGGDVKEGEDVVGDVGVGDVEGRVEGDLVIGGGSGGGHVDNSFSSLPSSRRSSESDSDSSL